MVYDLKLAPWQWPFYVTGHPVEGFEDLRWKKGYNMKVALTIVFCFFAVTVASSLMTGFLFNRTYTKIFNVVPYISSTFLLFFTWVIANWSLCTLFNGEGTMRNICCISAYALVPYLFSVVINTAASNVLLGSEESFMTFITIIGVSWSVVLMFAGMKAVHQYSAPKTFFALLFTIAAMLIMLFLAILLVALFQQLFVFFYTIYTELMYRFSL